MIKKLKIRFIAIVIVIASLFTAVMLSVLYFSTFRRIVMRSSEAMKSYMADTMFVNDKGVFDHVFNKEENSYVEFDIFGVDYYENTNTVYPYGFDEDLTDEKKTFISNAVAAALSYESDDGIIESYGVRFLKEKTFFGERIVFLDMTYEEQTLSSLRISIITIGIAALGIIFIISLLLCKFAIKPVEKSWKQQKQLISDVSHELKTPLAVISANTEIIASNPDSFVSEQHVRLEYIKSETEKMASLLENMLYLARSDEAVRQYEKTEIDFGELVYSSVLPLESVCYEKGITISTNIEPNLKVYGNAGLLSRLVVIFIDNAIKYSPASGVISVDLYHIDDKIFLAVNNKGDVIPPEKIAHIFERFYRVDDSRSHEKSGFGLGLSIADSIVKIHDGKIDVSSDETNGTTFIITLKKA